MPYDTVLIPRAGYTDSNIRHTVTKNHCLRISKSTWSNSSPFCPADRSLCSAGIPSYPTA